MKRKTKTKKKLKRWLKKRRIRRQLIEHHDQVWKLGKFYCSEYVALNQPWIREIPFHEFLRRQISEAGDDVA